MKKILRKISMIMCSLLLLFSVVCSSTSNVEAASKTLTGKVPVVVSRDYNNGNGYVEVYHAGKKVYGGSMSKKKMTIYVNLKNVPKKSTYTFTLTYSDMLNPSGKSKSFTVKASDVKPKFPFFVEHRLKVKMEKNLLNGWMPTITKITHGRYLV